MIALRVFSPALFAVPLIGECVMAGKKPQMLAHNGRLKGAALPGLDARCLCKRKGAATRRPFSQVFGGFVAGSVTCR